jgi:hypothetical protein
MRSAATLRNAALLALGATVWCSGANGTPSCQGTYAATLLQPLPERVVADLDIHDRSQRNLMLADRFLRECARRVSWSGRTLTCCCT